MPTDGLQRQGRCWPSNAVGIRKSFGIWFAAASVLTQHNLLIRQELVGQLCSHLVLSGMSPSWASRPSKSAFGLNDHWVQGAIECWRKVNTGSLFPSFITVSHMTSMSYSKNICLSTSVYRDCSLMIGTFQNWGYSIFQRIVTKAMFVVCEVHLYILHLAAESYGLRFYDDIICFSSHYICHSAVDLLHAWVACNAKQCPLIMGRSHWINYSHTMYDTEGLEDDSWCADRCKFLQRVELFAGSLQWNKIWCTTRKGELYISLDFEFEYRMIVWRLVRVFLLQADKLPSRQYRNTSDTHQQQLPAG